MWLGYLAHQRETTGPASTGPAGQSPSPPTSWVLGAVAWLAPQAPIETLSIDRAKRQSKLDKTYRLVVPRPSLEFSGPGEGQSAGRPTKTKGAGCPALPSAPTDGARRQLAFDLSIGPNGPCRAPAWFDSSIGATDHALRQLGLTLPSAPTDRALGQLGLTLPSASTDPAQRQLGFLRPSRPGSVCHRACRL